VNSKNADELFNTYRFKYEYCFVLMLIMFVFSFDVAASEAGAGDVKSSYVNVNTLKCEAFDVVIETYCEVDVDDFPVCGSQRVVFSDGKNKKTSEVIYKYNFDTGIQQLIVEASCNKLANNDLYVVLRSTTFGNCDTCEWIDVFTLKGKYIGSSDGNYDSRSFIHKLLNRKMLDLIFDGFFVERIEVHRSRDSQDK